MLSGRGLCDELITRPEEFYRLCCIVVCDLEISRMGAPYIYDIRSLRVNDDDTTTDRSVMKTKVEFWNYVCCMPGKPVMCITSIRETSDLKDWEIITSKKPA